MNNLKTIEEIDQKAITLCGYLNIGKDDVVVSGSDNYYEADSAEYLVLTDEEADERVIEYIKESLWAFNASFLADFTGLPESIFTALQPQCEDANEAILALIDQKEGIEYFSEQAVSADGRGHFLSGYDGEEVEADEYFIYRTN